MGSLAAPPEGAEADAWPKLAQWPVSRPADWLQWVNEPLSKAEIAELQVSVNRGRPFGDPEWVAKTAKGLNLGHTLRERGRRERSRRTKGGNQW